MTNTTPLRLSGCALALASALALLSGCDKAQPPGSSVGAASAPAAGAASFKSIDITGADYAKEFRLTDGQGKARSLSDFAGKVVVVFFGYTQCPDVCPTTMVELAQVKKSLGADGGRLIGVFVTLDPERDTPEVLRAYVDNFGADFVGLRGSPDETKAVAKHFKVFYAKVPGKTEGAYTLDHTAGSYIFDTKGRIRLFTRYGIGTEALTQDIRQLLAEPG